MFRGFSTWGMGIMWQSLIRGAILGPLSLRALLRDC